MINVMTNLLVKVLSCVLVVVVNGFEEMTVVIEVQILVAENDHLDHFKVVNSQHHIEVI